MKKPFVLVVKRRGLNSIQDIEKRLSAIEVMQRRLELSPEKKVTHKPVAPTNRNRDLQ